MTGLRGAVGSEVGRRYRANFDVAHLDLDPLLAVVADGMGDSDGSALAGRTTVDTFVERDPGRAGEDRAGDDPGGGLGRAGPGGRDRPTRRRYGRLHADRADRGRRQGGDGLWITQLGDSRVYRFRDDLLELLTVDHTMAWLGVAHGLYAFDSPQAKAARYNLTRYVGHAARPEPDVLSVVTAPGDVYLLCSDGVAEQVPYQRIREILRLHIEPGAMVERLLAAADVAGGQDNATAIVVRVPF